jgi:hypothetical protein
MAQTEAQVLGAELERVSPKVSTLFERDSVFYANIEKRPTEVVSSRDMRVPLEISPGGLFGGFDPDGGDMGRGEGPTYDKAVVNTVPMKHAVEWTTKAQWATDDKRKAVVNSFRDLLAKSMAEFRRQVDSSCMTGGDGVLATAVTVAINTPAGFDTLTCTGVGADGFGARLLRKGQKVSFYSADLLTKRAGGEMSIVYIDYPNKIFRIVTGTVVPQATDKVVVSGPTSTPPVWLKGVPYHHNSASVGSWLGFDRAATPEIRANRVAAGAGLTMPLPRLALNKIGDRVGIDNRGKRCTAWLHPCQKQAFEDIAQGLIFIPKQPKEEGFDPYFNDNMRMAGAPIKESYSWDKTRVDFVDNDVWGRAEMHAPGFYSVDGRKIFELRGASGGLAAAMIFYIVASFNLFVNNPAATAYIDTLTVPSGY